MQNFIEQEWHPLSRPIEKLIQSVYLEQMVMIIRTWIAANPINFTLFY